MHDIMLYLAGWVYKYIVLDSSFVQDQFWSDPYLINYDQ